MPDQRQASRVQTLDLASISFADAAEIAALSNVGWPCADTQPEAIAKRTLEDQSSGKSLPGSHLWHIIREDDKIIASAETFPREIRVHEKPLTILALASVCTEPAYRGNGVGSAVVSAAFERVRDFIYPYALFQTTHRRRLFYERLGAVIVPETSILNSLDPGALSGSPFWDEIVMYFPASRRWPTGHIDTLGPGW